MSALSLAHVTCHTSLRLKLASSSRCTLDVKSNSRMVELVSMSDIRDDVLLMKILEARMPLDSLR